MENITPEFCLRLAVGLGLFAFGWTLFRLGLNAVGFGLGFLFGFSFYQMLITLAPEINPDLIRYFPTHPLTPYIAGAVTGILGVILSKRLFAAAIFLAVFAGSLYILYADKDQRELVERLFAAIGILNALNRTLGEAWPAVLAVIIAVLFILAQKQIVIALTACAGGYLIADSFNVPIAFLPLSFIGFLLQQKQKKRKVKIVKEE